MVWIDTLATVLIAIGSVVTLLVTVVGAVRWVVRRELHPLHQRFETWTAAHEHRHDRDHRAVASAFKRSGLHPPDGWNGSHRSDMEGGDRP